MVPRILDEVPHNQEVPEYFICLMIPISNSSRAWYSSGFFRSTPRSSSCLIEVSSRLRKPARETSSK